MKKLIVFLTTLLFAISSVAFAENKIVIATTAGSDVAILKKAKEIAATKGLEVEIVEFTDYILPNVALVDKKVDLNSFQHQPYLDTFVESRGVDLVSIGKTYISPMGIYSNKIKSLDELKKGDTIAIPNDPTNGGRALLMLQAAGVIKLKADAGLTARPRDVVENPKNIKIKELDAAQTARALKKSVTASAINNTFASPAGLNPLKDAIYMESHDSPYVNIIVARSAEKDDPRFKLFVECYQSQEVAELILELYEGATLPAFDYVKK